MFINIERVAFPHKSQPTSQQFQIYSFLCHKGLFSLRRSDSELFLLTSTALPYCKFLLLQGESYKFFMQYFCFTTFSTLQYNLKNSFHFGPCFHICKTSCMGLSVQCNRAKYFFCNKEKKIDLCPHCSQCWKTEKKQTTEKSGNTKVHREPLLYDAQNPFMSKLQTFLLQYHSQAETEELLCRFLQNRRARCLNENSDKLILTQANHLLF